MNDHLQKMKQETEAAIARILQEFKDSTGLTPLHVIVTTGKELSAGVTVYMEARL